MIRSRYLSLDAMRGLAAIAVVLYHLNSHFVPNAFLAVDFFFLLSGFILAEVYIKKLEEGLSLFSFLKIRISRLYPLYLLGFFISIIQAVLILHRSGYAKLIELIVSLPTEIFMLPSLFVLVGQKSAITLFPLYPINGPTWSIFFELVINVLFAISLFRFKSLYLLVITVLSFLALTALAIKYQTINMGWEWSSVTGGLARVAFSFVGGMLIQKLQFHKKRKESWLAILPIGLLVLCLGFQVESLPQYLFGLVFCGVISPLVLIAGAKFEIPSAGARLCQYLGFVSYPIYILHRAFKDIFETLAVKLHLTPLFEAIIFILFINVIALIAGKYLDAPIRDAIERRLFVNKNVAPPP